MNLRKQLHKYYITRLAGTYSGSYQHCYMKKISLSILLFFISFCIKAQDKPASDTSTIPKTTSTKPPEFSEFITALQALEKKLNEQQQELARLKKENNLMKEQVEKIASASFIFTTNRKVEVSRVGSKQGVYN